MVSPKAIVVAVLSALALAASGCSGDSDAEAESPPATTTQQVETRPPTQSAFDISTFRAEFEERFGTPGDEASWWGRITGMKTSSGNPRWLEITAELEESDPLLGLICGAAMNLALDSAAGDGIDAVRMMGSGGAELGGCA